MPEKNRNHETPRSLSKALIGFSLRCFPFSAVNTNATPTGILASYIFGIIVNVLVFFATKYLLLPLLLLLLLLLVSVSYLVLRTQSATKEDIRVEDYYYY